MHDGSQKVRQSMATVILPAGQNEKSVTGTLILPETPGRKKYPGVVFYHGLTSSERSCLELAESLARQNIACLTVNFRGHGRSWGNFNELTVEDLILDGLAAYDFLSSQPEIDNNRIGICGSSLGAAIALAVASQRKVKPLVLRAPAVYTEEMRRLKLTEIKKREKIIFTDIKNPAETPEVEAATNFTGELLIIASEKDEYIPWIIPETLFLVAVKAKEKKLLYLNGAGQVLTEPVWPEKFRKLTESWLVKYL